MDSDEDLKLNRREEAWHNWYACVLYVLVLTALIAAIILFWLHGRFNIG